MTTLGHSLTGLSLAALTLPQGMRRRELLVIGHFYILFVNVPDLPLPGWGHDRYDVSHSLFVNALGVALVIGALAMWPPTRERLGAAVLLGYAVAWLSHLLLDTLYGHGRGLAMFWPVSDAHLALPVPWFETFDVEHPLSPRNGRVLAIEAAFYGALFGLALLVRRARSR